LLTCIDFVRYNKKDYEVWDFIEHKFKNYITLETVINEKSTTKTIFIVGFDSKKEIKIGRSHDSDIRITDISVSRYHAYIRFKGDHITIDDNASKFGSGVLLQHPKIPVLKNTSLPIQIGRSLITFYIKKRWSICDCLNPCKKKVITSHDYAEINSKYITKENLVIVKVQNDDLDQSESSSSLSQKTDIIQKAIQGQDMLADMLEDNGEISMQINQIVTSNKRYNSANLEIEFTDKIISGPQRAMTKQDEN
jgi:hypothetical protein